MSIPAGTGFDYIVIGGGSAGCVLANRLSRDPAVRVLLLEAGAAAHNFWLKLPVGYFKTIYDPRFSRLFPVEAQAETGDRTILWPRGKALGGSSVINGLLYIRGQHEDYDDWADLGATGPDSERRSRRRNASGCPRSAGRLPRLPIPRR